MTTQISGDTGVSQCQPSSVSQDDLQSNVVGKGPAFYAYQSVGTNIPASVFTKVIFGSEQADTSNAYNPTTGEFVVPVTGFYIFSWSVGFTTSSPGVSYSRLRRGASVVVFGSSAEMNFLGSISAGSFTLFCTIGDIITVETYQGAVANLTTDNNSTTFSGVLVRAAQ